MDTVGTIEYDAVINTGDLRKSAKEADKIADQTGRNIERSFTKRMGGAAQELGGAFGNVADSLGGVLRAAIAVGTTGTFGIGAMIKASFDQVRAVENARASMIGFGASIEDVDEVMRRTVAFVRSERGTLFQRQDILATTAALQGMGISLDRVSSGAETVAKATIPAGASFDSIVDILRSVDAEGSLGVVRFRQLAAAGIYLDDSLINTSQSAESLLEAMEEVLPDSLIADRAKTIDGAMIQTQSAFRDLGGAILGVDADTSTFVEGGLGDRLVGFLFDLRENLRSPELRAGFQEIGSQLAEFAKQALPVIQNVFQWLVANWSTIVNGILAIGAAFVAAKVGSAIGAIGAALTSGPFGIIAVTVTALVGALVFLEREFGTITSIVEFFSRVIANVPSFFDALGRDIQSFVNDTLTNLNNTWNGITQAIDEFISAAQRVVNSAINVVTQAIQAAINWLIEYRQWFINIGIVLGTILGPALVRAAAIAATSAGRATGAWITASGRMIASFVATAGRATANAAVAGAAWATQAVRATIAWIRQLPRMIATMAVTAARAVVSAAIAGGAWVRQSALVAVGWIASFKAIIVQMSIVTARFVANAIRIGASWLLALGPIGAVVAVVIGVVALIIANWESLSEIFANVWNGLVSLWGGLVDFFTGLWNGVVAVTQAVFNGLVDWFTGVIGVYRQIFSSIGNFITGVFNGVVNSIRAVFNGLFGFFSGLWNNIVGLFGRVGTAVGDAIGGAVRGALNAVIGGAVNIINGFIDAINGAIDAIRALPGLGGIGRLDRLNVPQLADGGVVTSPTLALIGEGNESEAVIPLSRLDDMLNGDDSGDGRNVEINQYNTVNTQVDMNLVNRRLTYDLARA